MQYCQQPTVYQYDHRSRAQQQAEPVENANLKVAGKVLVVALVVAGLATAAFFTFGAASAAGSAALSSVGTASAGTVFTSWMNAGALYGTGVGLVISGIATPFVASETKMFKATKKNRKDVLDFLAAELLTTTFLTGYFALSGANEGMRYGMIAVIVGGGAAASK